MEITTTNNICRVCLTEDGLFQSVFLKENSSGVSIHISEMLNACATIQVNEGDGLPNQICSECSEQTVKLYSFKIRCERSDIILRERLEKSKAETIEIKLECDEEIDEEMCENDQEKISYEASREESEINKFESDFRQKSVNQDDLSTNQEIVEEIKVENPKIPDENIQIKYNSISPHLMESKTSVFPCPECDFVFVEKENLDQHIPDFHIKKEPEVSCDENLKTEQQLEEISSLFENELHGCDICFKGFSQKFELKEHMKTHFSTSEQTDDQPSTSNVICEREFYKSYECDVCKKTFKTCSSLARHQMLHSGEKPFKCKICKKRFALSSYLASHKKTHTGEKQHECEMCNKKFTKSAGLMRHKRTHTGEKPFKCEVCEKEFIQDADLKRHGRIHMVKNRFPIQINWRYVKDFNRVRNHTNVNNER